MGIFVGCKKNKLDLFEFPCLNKYIYIHPSSYTINNNEDLLSWSVIELVLGLVVELAAGMVEASVFLLAG